MGNSSFLVEFLGEMEEWLFVIELLIDKKDCNLV
jgi:hypothetical protein